MAMKALLRTVLISCIFLVCRPYLTGATLVLCENPHTTRKDSMEVIYQSLLNKNYEKALDYLTLILKKELALQHAAPATLSYLFGNMGICYKNLWQFEEAIEAYTKALEYSIRAYGKRSAYTATIYNNLGNLYNTTGEYNTAALYLQNALDIYQHLAPAVPAEESRVLNNLGNNANKTGNYEQAYRYTLQSIEKRKQAGETNLGNPYHNLANILVQLGRYNEAEEYFRLSTDHLSYAPKSTSQDLVMAYLSYGLFLTDQAGATEEGKNMYQQALA